MNHDNYDIREDEFIALKAIWEAAGDVLGQPARRYPYEKAVEAASDAIAKSPMDFKRDPDRAMPINAEEVIAQLDELGYIHIAHDNSDETNDDLYMVWMPVFIGGMIEDLRDHNFSTGVERPAPDNIDKCLAWAMWHIMHNGGLMDATDLEWEVADHFEDDEHFKQHWTMKDDSTHGGEWVVAQLEENRWVDRSESDMLLPTEEGKAMQAKLLEWGKTLINASLDRVDRDSLKKLAEKIEEVKRDNNNGADFLYAGYAYSIVASQFHGHSATIKAAAEGIMEVLLDLNCVYRNSYNVIRLGALADYALSITLED